MIRAKMRKRDGKNGKRLVDVNIKTKEIGAMFRELDAILLSVKEGIEQIKAPDMRQQAEGWLKLVAGKYAKK